MTADAAGTLTVRAEADSALADTCAEVDLESDAVIARAATDRAATTGVDGTVATPSGRHRHRQHARRRQLRLLDPAPWLIGAGALVLRLATAAHGPTDWDSAQYASAVSHFDVTHGQPQPPGYWLYVESARLVTHVTGLGTIASLVLVSAIASAAATGLATLAGRDMGGRWMGVAVGAVVATSPFAWFSGSIVATYSFDMVACSLLIVLARRARPGSWHGVGAVVVLGIATGFRQSIAEEFAVLALIAVVASTRRWRRFVITVLAAIGAVAVWLVPMAVEQPGGIGAWWRAVRTEAAGAAQSTSILDHAAGGRVNLGTFAAYTVVALAPVAALTVVAAVVLVVRRAAHAPPRRPLEPAEPSRTGPWYQSIGIVLGAAIVPPACLVALVQFAKGGYLLAYLPAAVMALLLPVAAVNRRGTNRTVSRLAITATTLGVALVVALGAQRFLDGAGVLPQRSVRASGGLWLQQTRYQAPYLDTANAIRVADAFDTTLGGLASVIDPRRDVVVFDTLDGGQNIYRNAGWALPEQRIALIGPSQLLYNEQRGALYYRSGNTVAVGTSGSVFLVASPALPGLASLVAQGDAIPVALRTPIGGYRVWRILPGASVIGVHVIEQSGSRPLGSAI